MPWPLHGGAAIHNFSMLQALAELYEVDLLTVGSPADEVSELCGRVLIASPHYGDETAALSARRWGGALGATLLGRQPLWLSSKTHPAMRKLARDLCATGGYDAIHASELSSAADLLSVPRPPLIYDAHNCEWQLLNRRAEREGAAPVRALIRMEARRLKAYEARVLREADAVLCVSDADRKMLAALNAEAGGSGAGFHVAPNAVDLAHYLPARDTAPIPGRVLLPGKWDWRPNEIGLDWFCDEVLPHLVTRTGGRAEVIVAGRLTARQVTRLSALPLVTPLANPDDMIAEFGRASVIAAPVKVSSGTRLRLVEALASRRAVVTTGAGALGLNGGEAGAWIETDDDEEFAGALAVSAFDPGHRAPYEARGWDYVQAFDWRRIIPVLADLYTPLLERGRG